MILLTWGYFSDSGLEISEKKALALHPKNYWHIFACLFVALRPKSTAMVMAGRSAHLTTLFPGQA